MNLPEEAPPLNPWPFLVGDAVLLVTAYVVASQAAAPLAGAALIAVVVCVALGAVLATIPFLLNHTHRQELALLEREREIAALARTTATSAEQISIAASSLHGIADAASRSVKAAEALPHKLQEKINEFKAQLNEVAVTENESLSQEINMLRASETERLETALTAIKKTATDLAMVEAVSRKHIGELNEALGRVASTANKAATEAAASIAAARSTAEKALSAAETAASAALQKATANAFADIERKFNVLAADFANQLKRTAAETKPAPAAFASAPEPTSEVVQALPRSAAPKAHEASPQVEPAPEPEAISLSTFTPPVSTVETASASRDETSTQTEENAPTAVAVLEPRPARKRAPKKQPAVDDEPSLGLDVSTEYSQVPPEEAAPAVSADGLTRLLVTAYIGIGNKLFLRGEGPGLSWERGVPLQFVSIGRWRWETADAVDPLQLKIYKNDEIECTAVGQLTLTPGHQREVTANFS